MLWWAGPREEQWRRLSRWFSSPAHTLQPEKCSSIHFLHIGKFFFFFLRIIVPLKTSGQQNEIMTWPFLLSHLPVFSQYSPCSGQAQNLPHLLIPEEWQGPPPLPQPPATHLSLGNFSQVLTYRLTNFSTWHFSFFPLCFLVQTFTVTSYCIAVTRMSVFLYNL